MSREVVLTSIRAALQGKRPGTASEPEPYPRSGMLDVAERLHRLEDRLLEYDARIFHCTEGGLRQQIADALLASGKSKIVHPAGVPTRWLDAKISWTPDSNGTNDQLSYAQIEAFDGVLTGATVAVAESGSIVLQHGPAEGRRALTLLPDYHLCILFEEQVVETLPECFDRLRQSATRPTTFISGPSATADIEMTRIKGVHGPRHLGVVLVT